MRLVPWCVITDSEGLSWLRSRWWGLRLPPSPEERNRYDRAVDLGRGRGAAKNCAEDHERLAADWQAARRQDREILACPGARSQPVCADPPTRRACRRGA